MVAGVLPCSLGSEARSCDAESENFIPAELSPPPWAMGTFRILYVSELLS